MADDAERLDVGRVIGGTWRTLMRHLPFFLLTGVVLFTAPQVASSYYGVLYPQDPWAGGWVRLGVGAISLLLEGVILRAALDDLMGRRVSLFKSLWGGLRFFFPLLGVGLLTSIGIGLGALLLIVPGLILLVRWCVSAAVAVEEKTNPVDAIGRSAELGEGSRWRIFGLILLYLVLYFVTLLGVRWISLNLRMDFLTSTQQYLALATLEDGLFTLDVLIRLVGTAAIYAELRKAKEGSVQVAEVFD